jgi:hypothetical protein
MSENEQKAEPNSPATANNKADQAVPKIDFGVEEKTDTAADSGQGKDVGVEKGSGSDTKLPQEKDGAPAKDAEASKNAEATKDPEAKEIAEPKKTAEPVNEDDSNKKFQADVEARFERQLAVNRRLASILEEQLELLLSVRQSMLAIQQTLESSAASKKKLEMALETVKSGAEGLPDVHWINRVRGTLAMLQRSGNV